MNLIKSFPGVLEGSVESEIARLAKEDTVRRLWAGDHTLWGTVPDDISNRLGWLTVTDEMRRRTGELTNFADEIRRDGYSRVVLLGIGGSSLAGEALCRTFNKAAGYPEFSILDSTLPGSIQATADSIEPENTLFLVSSKSGTTMEPIFLYRYFRKLVEKNNNGGAGRNFLAITDPGSPLVSLSKQAKFRKIFLNSPNIGGRFSVLSYFGLLPGALSGIDIEKIIHRADETRRACSAAGGRENPGLHMGAIIGAAARNGRDKLTLITSRSLEGFGNWVEQLLAESTGKQKKGVIPVIGEPLVSPGLYGQDRLFVQIRLEGDENGAADNAVNQLKAYGHPVVILPMQDRFDIGGQFFLWEFATAVAGSIIGVNPFDQPDVNGAKDTTGALLYQYIQRNKLPRSLQNSPPDRLFDYIAPGRYVGLMAFFPETDHSNQIIKDIRRTMLEKYGVATTLGYGPRFLHSTGQLHKGGPDCGIFLQLTASRDNDISIPGLPYTFGEVADAQSQGDFQALQRLGRIVVNQNLNQDGLAALKTLVGDSKSASVCETGEAMFNGSGSMLPDFG